MLRFLFVSLLKRCLTFIPVSFKTTLRDRIPEAWLYYLQQKVRGEKWRVIHSTNLAKVLESKLWGGFSVPALKELLTMMDDESITLPTKSEIAWILARWYWCQATPEQTAVYLAFIRESRLKRFWYKSFRLLEIDCLMTLNEPTLARQRAEEAMTVFPNCFHCRLAYSNTWVDIDKKLHFSFGDEERLKLINAIYHKTGVSRISKIDPKETLALSNICGQSKPFSKESVPDVKVSIIMPVYNASATLGIAIKSLLQQTWSQLEIIVVDDCSPDNTVAVAQSFASLDSRVRVVEQKTNLGAYSARNLGLKHATGEYVTTHDADDWSHPQKIEIQVRNLLCNPDHKANLTHWVRALPNLYFRGTSRPSGRLIQMNHSSLMLSRELLLTLGGWDRVRITGDTELIWRLGYHLHDGKPIELLPAVPLSFALEDTSSLTRNDRTHIRTMFYGVRREYREAITHWHQNSNHHTLPLLESDISHEYISERLFPAPGLILPKRTSWELDRLMLMDFNLNGPSLDEAFKILEEWINNGLKVGVFQWCYYPLDVKEPLNKSIRDLALEKKIKVIAPGEEVKVQDVLLCNPALAMYIIDLPPIIKTEVITVLSRANFSISQTGKPETWTQYEVEKVIKKVFRLPCRFVEKSFNEY